MCKCKIRKLKTISSSTDKGKCRVGKGNMGELSWLLFAKSVRDLQDRMWRKTRSITGEQENNSRRSCAGVDPNRNWDSHWGGKISFSAAGDI